MAPVTASLPSSPSSCLLTLDNGVRVVTLPMPHLRSASVGVFVRAGSRNESARLNGISHFLEHMAFKGTATRDVQAINLDAERIGADMNAYTSKDTTAYYLNGLGAHATGMLAMLADIVLASTFPEAEIEREREVLLQELVEYDEDPQSVVAQLLDMAAFGTQPLARPVIGTRRNVARITRDELVGFVQRHYVGANIVVAAGGGIDVQAFRCAAQRLFGGVPRGEASACAPMSHVGGLKARRRAGVSQVHVAIALPVPTMREGHEAGQMAAMLLGGGMSAPLVDEVRERRGLAYHVGSDAEASDVHGLLLIDAVTQPQHLDEVLATTGRLVRQQAGGIDPVQLERARSQLAVQAVRRRESPFSAIESAAEHLFVHGCVPDAEAALQRLQAVTAEDVRAVFARAAQATPALAVAGRKVDDAVFGRLVAAMR